MSATGSVSDEWDMSSYDYIGEHSGGDVGRAGVDVRMMSSYEDMTEVALMTVVAQLGQALRARRVELAMSQEQVCASAGVARSWLSKVEAGRHRGAELQKVLDLAATLGLTLVLTHDGAAAAAVVAPAAPPADGGGERPRPTGRPAPERTRPARPVSPPPVEPERPRPSRLTEGDPFEHLLG